ncbi:hypothetical protein PAPYR_9935 [Paratrimastix pyriformis]|uniref:Uncharacterized protein n=1 Tax=Paratrimastix pyriformis TaxID=342808 RepID=A0ABQ8U770_9EUKA|nr:hypothetical protein PAPYR_9935 [Paratrimastix pyriformis]
MEGAGYGRLGTFGAFAAVRRGFLQPLSLTRRALRAGRDPLEEMFGVRMVDHESLFVVFFETFGSCDSQLDCFTALRGTDSFPPYSASVAGVSSSEWAYA